jgi:hypothetical protein
MSSKLISSLSSPSRTRVPLTTFSPLGAPPQVHKPPPSSVLALGWYGRFFSHAWPKSPPTLTGSVPKAVTLAARRATKDNIIIVLISKPTLPLTAGGASPSIKAFRDAALCRPLRLLICHKYFPLFPSHPHSQVRFSLQIQTARSISSINRQLGLGVDHHGRK